METEKDQQLWRLAKKRVGFKKHLATYVIVNGMLWLLWYFTGQDRDEGFPWPIWPTFGWGIGLFFDFLGAYIHTGTDAIEKEYDKLKNKQ